MLQLKVSKSQKQIMASWILPKNERLGIFQYIKLPQRSFFGRIQDNIFFFEIFWPLDISSVCCIVCSKSSVCMVESRIKIFPNLTQLVSQEINFVKEKGE